jgi:hypothetical protein
MGSAAQREKAASSAWPKHGTMMQIGGGRRDGSRFLRLEKGIRVPDECSYVISYGRSWTVFRWLAIVVCVAGASISLVAPLALYTKLVGLLLSVFIGTLFVRSFFIKAIALSIEPRGVLVGGDPLRFPKGSYVIPWDEVRRIVLWKRAVPIGFLPVKFTAASVVYIGLEMKSTEMQVGSSPRRLVKFSVPGNAGFDFSGIAIPTGGAKFDSVRLIEAVMNNASTVAIVDATTDA